MGEKGLPTGLMKQKDIDEKRARKKKWKLQRKELLVNLIEVMKCPLITIKVKGHGGTIRSFATLLAGRCGVERSSGRTTSDLVQDSGLPLFRNSNSSQKPFAVCQRSLLITASLWFCFFC